MDTLQTIRPELLTLSPMQAQALMPYAWVFVGSILAIIFSVLKWIQPKWSVFLITVATCVVGILASANLIQESSLNLFGGMMISDAFSHVFNIIFLASTGFTALVSFRYLDKEQIQHPEYYVLLLLAALGMMTMSSALDLIVIFISLELMSLSVYALVGFRRSDRRSNEAAMKYFVLGSAASAILLYGAALLYGATGQTGIKAIWHFIQLHPEAVNPLFLLGAALVLFGFLFKIASVPFHMWMPDVYEGAPTPITGFMTTGLKAAAFATLIRVFISMGYGKSVSVLFERHVHDVLWVSAVLTAVVGNVIALTQTNIKRMLGYSSIAHTGYLLVGILAGSRSELGYYPALFYLVSYSIMNLGAFAILALISSKDDAGLNLHDLSGIASKHPWLSFSMAVFLFSMAGIPPTAGFAAKYLVFYAAIQAQEVSLVVISVLCSAISVYYYLRILVYMYMRDPVGMTPRARVSVWAGATVAVMVILTLQLGILPARVVDVAKRAIASL